MVFIQRVIDRTINRPEKKIKRDAKAIPALLDVHHRVDYFGNSEKS